MNWKTRVLKVPVEVKRCWLLPSRLSLHRQGL